MAVPVYATDLTAIIEEMPSTTGWTALGGGAAGLSAPETDFFIQGANCISKAGWSTAIKGMIYNNGSGVTVPANGAVLMWLYYWAPNAADTKAGGGYRHIVGSGTGDYKEWFVAGSDTMPFAGWLLSAVDPSVVADNTVGAPSGTLQYFGSTIDVPAAGPSKGNPIGVDAIRYGRCRLEYTNGQAGDYATFAGAQAYGDAVARRWGLLSLRDGAYFMSGFHSLGVVGTAVAFVDSNRIIFLRDHDRVSAGFNRIEILNASSTVDWTNVQFVALGTNSPGTLVVTAGILTASLCQFTDMGAFVLLSSSSLTDCTFRRTKAITAPGSSLTGCSVEASTVATDTSAVVWDVNVDVDGKLDDMTFTKGTNAHHAIELGTTSPLTVTLRGITFSGFNTANAQNDSVVHVKRTAGSVTINAVDVTGTVSYKTDGATVTVVANPVTLSVHVEDIVTGSALIGVRVLVKAATGGPKPYQAAVSLTRVGTTVTVNHTTHGLATNDWAVIEGANEGEYNGVWQVTFVDTNSYTYQVPTTPASPATGAPKSTFAPIHGTTNGTGDISDTRTYTGNQPISGRARERDTDPPYKTSLFSGTINNTAGLSIVVGMIQD